MQYIICPRLPPLLLRARGRPPPGLLAMLVLAGWARVAVAMRARGAALLVVLAGAALLVVVGAALVMPAGAQRPSFSFFQDRPCRALRLLLCSRLAFGSILLVA